MQLSILQHTGQMPTRKADPAKVSVVLRLRSPEEVVPQHPRPPPPSSNTSGTGWFGDTARRGPLYPEGTLTLEHHCSLEGRRGEAILPPPPRCLHPPGAGPYIHMAARIPVFSEHGLAFLAAHRLVSR